MQQDETRMIIAGGTILTMDEQLSVFDPGMLVIEGSKITYCGSYDQELLSEYPKAEILSGTGKIIIPGLVNGHTHIGMSLFRTLADDVKDRLHSVIFPLEKQLLSADMVSTASSLGLYEMLLSGTTTIADMYYFSASVAQAAEVSGIRAVIGQSVTTAASADAAGAGASFELIRDLAALWEGHRRISPALAPHAPYSLTLSEMEQTSLISEELSLPILSHLAEMPFEMPYTLEKYGLRPVELYEKAGLLGERSVMAHCITADESDRRILASSGTGIITNPAANSKSAKGIAPVYEFSQITDRLGIGTDGPMSGNRLDTIGLLRWTSMLQKITHRNPTILPPAKILEMATIGGAKALHLERITGSLEVGKRADIVMIGTDSPSMYPIYEPYAAVVYGASSEDVQTVIIEGQLVVRDRTCLTLDRETLLSEAAGYQKEIRERFC